MRGIKQKGEIEYKIFLCTSWRTEETCPFYETVHPMCSSLYKPDEELMNLYNNLMEAAKFKSVNWIKTESLDFFTQNNDIEVVDFIKIDIQGAELDVLWEGLVLLQM